jgi:nucleoside-diphosphate-sugar epimerase
LRLRGSAGSVGSVSGESVLVTGGSGFIGSHCILQLLDAGYRVRTTGPDLSTSIQLVQRLLDHGMPGIPRLSFGLVDVRDVADLHLRAMTNPAAAGERFLAIAGDYMTIEEIAQVLGARMGAGAARVPTRVLPNWMVRLASLFDSSLRGVVPELGKTKRASNEKARRLLGWAPRSNEESILATAESLVRLGLLKSAGAPAEA